MTTIASTDTKTATNASGTTGNSAALLMSEQKTLYIIRGIPGSGKSTLAQCLHLTGMVDEHYEADDYWYLLGGGVRYAFDPKYLGDAHEWCQNLVESAMADGMNVAVSNTFTRRKEYSTYLRMAEEYGYHVNEIICKGGYENTHDVPADIVQKMLDGFEY